MYLFHIDHNFPEMPSTEQKLQRLLGLGKWEHPVDHRLDLVLLVELHHLLEAVLGPVDDSLESDVPAQRQHIHVSPVLGLIHLAGKIPDAVYKSTKRNTVKALLQRLRTTGLENDVCTVVVGVLHHGFFPIGRGAVVDGVVCTELFGLLEFLVGR